MYGKHRNKGEKNESNNTLHTLKLGLPMGGRGYKPLSYEQTFDKIDAPTWSYLSKVE